jgi:hypothetical protein
MSSCAVDSPSQTEHEYFTEWFSDPKGYAINDIEIAQKETPFEIVLPRYLPDDIHDLPVITGFAGDDFNCNYPVNISYRRSGKGGIEIKEYCNYPVSQISGNLTELLYSGVKVFEEVSKTIGFDQNEKVIYVPVIYYTWDNNKIHFEVSIVEYEIDESRKIIRSMIEN